MIWQRHRYRGKQIVSLTSTPRGVSHSRDASPDPQGAKGVANVWAQTDSMILYLATLLSVPPGTLSSLFYQNNNSLPLALSKILDKFDPDTFTLPDGATKIAELKDLFPDEPVSLLQRCLCATAGETTKTVELVQTLREIYTKEGTPLAHDLLLGASRNRAKTPALVQSNFSEKSSAATIQGKSKMQTGVAFERPPSAQDCVSLALTLRSKRDDAYRSAARTWQAKHSLGNSGVAAYWAEHGRHLEKQARDWELRAARATVDERRRLARSLQTVDLHGLTVAQALTVTQECLNTWWNCMYLPIRCAVHRIHSLIHAGIAPTSPLLLTIITGAGKHSTNQNPVLLPAIKKLLERERYDWKFEGDRESRGSLVVTGLQGRRKGTIR